MKYWVHYLPDHRMVYLVGWESEILDYTEKSQLFVYKCDICNWYLCFITAQKELIPRVQIGCIFELDYWCGYIASYQIQSNHLVPISLPLHLLVTFHQYTLCMLELCPKSRPPFVFQRGFMGSWLCAQFLRKLWHCVHMEALHWHHHTQPSDIQYFLWFVFCHMWLSSSLPSTINQVSLDPFLRLDISQHLSTTCASSLVQVCACLCYLCLLRALQSPM